MVAPRILLYGFIHTLCTTIVFECTSAAGHSQRTHSGRSPLAPDGVAHLPKTLGSWALHRRIPGTTSTRRHVHSAQDDDHLSARFTGFRQVLGFPDLVEAEYADRCGVEQTVMNASGDVPQWYIRDRECGLTEAWTGEEGEVHAA